MRALRLSLVPALAVALSTACAPRAGRLRGTPAPEMRLPSAELPAGHRQVTFRWQYHDSDIEARGEGVTRVAPPDSARMDFFVDPGLGAGYALLVGDRLDAPGIALVRRYLPPPTLLWATLGRMSATGRDTTIRVDGDTIRADIGRDPVWRAAYVGARLVRLERIDGGRVVERVSRASDDAVRYEQLASRRTLSITVTRQDEVPEFDATIWRP